MSLTVDQRLDYLEKRLVILEGCFGKALEELSLINGEIEEKLTKPLPQCSPSQLGLTPEELDALPWKKYASGKGAWVFSRQQDGSPSKDPVIGRLAAKLAKEGALTIHGRKYSLGGDSGQFLARYPP